MKRVLVVFKEGCKKDVLIESAIFLRESFGYEILPLYIKDIRRDEIIPATMDGIIVNLGNNFFSQEREALEDEDIKDLKDRFNKLKVKNDLNVEFGFPWDIIKEYLKLADLLIFEKGETLSETAITALKNQFKPFIMIGENPLKSFEKIGISTDDGVKINKSVFTFINNFNTVDNFIMLTLLYKMEENKLLKYLEDRGKKVDVKTYDGDDAKKEYLATINDLDILIMGNLSRSYLFEKITAKKGLSIMEKSKTSIFIG